MLCLYYNGKKAGIHAWQYDDGNGNYAVGCDAGDACDGACDDAGDTGDGDAGASNDAGAGAGDGGLVDGTESWFL